MSEVGQILFQAPVSDANNWSCKVKKWKKQFYSEWFHWQSESNNFPWMERKVSIHARVNGQEGEKKRWIKVAKVIKTIN